MIYLSSRYADSEVTYILNSRTNTSVATVLRDTPQQDAEQSYRRVYIWREGDRLDSVSYRLLGASGDWWRILDANPEVINPLTIKPGTSLRVPE